MNYQLLSTVRFSKSIFKELCIVFAGALRSGQQGPIKTLPFVLSACVNRQSRSPSIPFPSDDIPSASPIGDGNTRPRYVTTF